MSDQNRPGDVPPDLPPEYAEAYRRGFERAYAGVPDDADPEPARDYDPGLDPELDSGHTTGEHRPLFADEVEPATWWSSPSRPQDVVETPRVGGSHRAEPEPAPDLLPLDEELAEPAEDDDRPDARPAWLVPALLAGAVVVLLLAAYGVGRLLSGSLANTDTSPPEPDGSVIPSDTSSSAASPSPSKKPSSKPATTAYKGATQTATIGGASGTCESKPGVDAAGNKVRYAPKNVYDGDMTTAWRCDGDGGGQKLTLNLADTTKIGQVGLIPGYAKTDVASGVDRYKENNRLTKVRWLFDDGTSVVQTLDPSPKNRSMQSLRVPVTKADQVIVEILDSKRGPRNTIAVSELRIGAVSG